MYGTTSGILTRRTTGFMNRDMKEHINVPSREINNMMLENINSFQRAMSSVLVVAMCFGLCPVYGISSHRAEDL
ncbi:hypothetical protein L9F63_002167, partial [Diploptera punctata]